jgi:hypothetical protein
MNGRFQTWTAHSIAVGVVWAGPLGLVPGLP